MGKSYILISFGRTNRRMDCRDLKKIHFVHKKTRPIVPKFEEDVPEDIEKSNSPTET